METYDTKTSLTKPLVCNTYTGLALVLDLLTPTLALGIRVKASLPYRGVVALVEA